VVVTAVADARIATALVEKCVGRLMKHRRQHFLRKFEQPGVDGEFVGTSRLKVVPGRARKMPTPTPVRSTQGNEHDVRETLDDMLKFGPSRFKSLNASGPSVIDSPSIHYFTTFVK